MACKTRIGALFYVHNVYGAFRMYEARIVRETTRTTRTARFGLYEACMMCVSSVYKVCTKVVRLRLLFNGLRHDRACYLGHGDCLAAYE